MITKEAVALRQPLFEYQVCSFSLQQMVKKLKPASTNYKLRTTNYKVKGTIAW